MLLTIGRTFDAKLEVYGVNKYEAEPVDFEYCQRVVIPNVESWEVVTGAAAKEIEEQMDGSCIDDDYDYTDGSIDDYHEYLVLHLVDGKVATFRNSYVDMYTR